MNGRVYDPQIGRFLSADPYIQAPYNTQSYNRYSYVMNNPLKYTDPSGYNPFKAIAKAWRSTWRGIKKYGRQVVAIVVAIYTGGATLAAGWSVWASGAAAGFVSGAISTGSLKGAMRGAVLGSVTAGVANHIGYGKSAFAKWAQKDIYNKAIAHGLSQGAISQISGGNFKEGFLGGAFSSYAGDSWLDASSSNNVITDTMISSVIGGVSAELGGGKFANGARSAAFVSLYNHKAGHRHRHGGLGRRMSTRESFQALADGLDVTSKTSLAVSVSTALTPAGPVAGVTSAVTGVFSSVIQFGLDLNGGEFFQNNAPYIAGKATTYVLGTIKFIPSNVAQSIGTGVEGVGTMIETAGDQ
jgi:hypothetical protein